MRTLCDKAVWLDGDMVQAWGDAPAVLDQYEASLKSVDGLEPKEGRHLTAAGQMPVVAT